MAKNEGNSSFKKLGNLMIIQYPNFTSSASLYTCCRKKDQYKIKKIIYCLQKSKITKIYES